jgi:hypothetical protein
MDLERGYTRVTRHQGGLAAGRQHIREMPDGDPHAVVIGEREALCGATVLKQPRLPWPVGSMEKLCPRCAAELARLEADRTSADE